MLLNSPCAVYTNSGYYLRVAFRALDCAALFEDRDSLRVLSIQRNTIALKVHINLPLCLKHLLIVDSGIDLQKLLVDGYNIEVKYCSLAHS